MIDSIVQDIKRAMNSGTMITRIIMVNVGLFVLINLLKVFTMGAGPGVFISVKNILSLPSDPITLIKQPWSIITHMFLHIGFWHIFWNMLLFYWFGRIVGDFLGDKRILPIYILSGLFGGLVYILSDHFLGGTGGNAFALGASAAVMAMLWTAASLSPDYIMHLILIGPVKLKYIALAILFLDIIGTASMINSGGHFAHLGGALFGMLYVYMLRRGTDMTSILSFNRNENPKRRKTAKKHFKVVYREEPGAKSDDSKNRPSEQQSELDRILDKINAQGYDKLTEEEKEFLYQASKKK
ncbi:MAG: rhomboid family intramembrane serine protease [Bacteroidia bacterium]|nr:rhomboid family intramembrane serine protease [Bacteroidia bacterium]